MLLALILVSALALGNFVFAWFMVWRWALVVRRNAARAHFVDPTTIGVFGIDGRYLGSVADLLREALPEVHPHEIPDQNEVN